MGDEITQSPIKVLTLKSLMASTFDPFRNFFLIGNFGIFYIPKLYLRLLFVALDTLSKATVCSLCLFND